mmetsp:Transcript_54429/g.172944  ORF Transcript_54429/g.172944 Transcript_54429/m.172944 type:complete len:90 (+) Transcript_54429:150-419(+)
MAAPDFPLHEKIQGLSWILGEWSGQGEGHYPTIPSFKYMETITFTHAGKVGVSPPHCASPDARSALKCASHGCGCGGRAARTSTRRRGG